jgi:hypothetical protein
MLTPAWVSDVLRLAQRFPARLCGLPGVERAGLRHAL